MSALEKQAAQPLSEVWPDDTETLGVTHGKARSGISKLTMFPSHVRIKNATRPHAELQGQLLPTGVDTLGLSKRSLRFLRDCMGCLHLLADGGPWRTVCRSRLAR